MNGPIFDNTPESLDRLAKAIRGGMDVMKDFDVFEHRTPLALAALKGNAKACRLLLEAGASPHQARAWLDGPSPVCEIIRSVQGDNIVPDMPFFKRTVEEGRAVLKVLLEFGASIDGPPVRESAYSRYRLMGQSPLHLAIAVSCEETVSLLAEFGANMDMEAIVPEAGGIPMSALWRAEYSKDQGMMIALLRHGAKDLYLGKPGRGITPFIGCVMGGWEKVVEYYVKERGEDLAQRHEGRTLLQVARTPAMRALLKSLKTEMAVKDAINVTDEVCPRDDRASIISSSCANRRFGSLPL